MYQPNNLNLEYEIKKLNCIVIKTLLTKLIYSIKWHLHYINDINNNSFPVLLNPINTTWEKINNWFY